MSLLNRLQMMRMKKRMTNKEIKDIWKCLIDAFTLIDDAEMNERRHMSLPMIRAVINDEFQDILNEKYALK